MPLLAARFVRQRLHALARVEDKTLTGTPTVLFLCTHNAGCSQMAAAYLTHLVGDRVQVRSAGSDPDDRVNPVAVQAMAEVGIDMSAEIPKVLTTEAVQESDVVITMGCGDVCHYFPGKEYLDWKLDDPAGRGIDAVRPIRDQIEHRIRDLLTELGIPSAA
ncbi:arsenate reductase ArsC [Nocardia sp. CA2R105]|nr:arsenate reductase ArsC [Nocardia coffeae]